MSANEELVARVMAAFNNHDVRAALEDMHADVVWDWEASIGPYRGRYRGHEQVERFLADFLDTWQRLAWTVLEVTEVAGGRVVFDVVARGYGRDGLELNARGAQVWTIRDGKVAYMQLFQSFADAQAAVGEP